MSGEKDQSVPFGSAPPPPPQGISNGPVSSSSSSFPQPPPYTAQYVNNIPQQYAYFPPGTLPQMIPGAMYHPQMAGMMPPPPPYEANHASGQQQAPGPQAPPVSYGYPYFQMAGQPFPGQVYPTWQYPAMYPTAAYPYNMAPPPPNMAVIMPDGFDSMARFDGISRPAIPPPPPGVAPNMAQLAMMYGQGNQVVVGQKKSNFF